MSILRTLLRRLAAPGAPRRRPAFRPGLEGLESRLALSLTTSEFQVNFDALLLNNAPASAGSPGGRSVVVWAADAGRGGLQIRGERYAAGGQRLGSEFIIGGTIRPDHTPVGNPAVAMDARGDFVVAWQGRLGIHARVYAASGFPRGKSFLVAANGAGSAGLVKEVLFPRVAMAADGSFVVAYEQFLPAPGLAAHADIFARLYRANGTPLARLRVSTGGDAGTSYNPDVAAAADGRFAVAYETSILPDGEPMANAGQVVVRTFSPAGAPRTRFDGADLQDYFRVDAPHLASDAAGNLLLAFSETTVTSSGFTLGLDAVPISSAGSQGAPIPLVTTAQDNLLANAIAEAPAGGSFVVAWTENARGAAPAMAHLHLLEASAAGQVHKTYDLGPGRYHASLTFHGPGAYLLTYTALHGAAAHPSAEIFAYRGQISRGAPPPPG